MEYTVPEVGTASLFSWEAETKTPAYKTNMKSKPGYCGNKKNGKCNRKALFRHNSENPELESVDPMERNINNII